MENKPYWSEIRNDYEPDINPEDGDVVRCICIDAWIYGEEAGRTIAKVFLTEHNDIVVDYIDAIAIADKEAQKVIAETVGKLERQRLNPEVETQMSVKYSDEVFEDVEVYGKRFQFSNTRIDRDSVPAGLYVYDLRENDDLSDFAAIEPYVFVNHGGTIIGKDPLEMGPDGYLPLTPDGDEDSLNFSPED